MDSIIYIGSKCRSSIKAFGLIIFLFMTAIAQAQSVDGNTYKLTLAEAVQFAKTQNKLVQVAGMEKAPPAKIKKTPAMRRCQPSTPTVLTNAFPI